MPIRLKRGGRSSLDNIGGGPLAISKGGTGVTAWDLFAVPTGATFPYSGSGAPTGYLECDGSAVSRTTYADLFAVLGTTFGSGDGSTTFNLPDLRGRMPVGAGQGSGLTNRTLGDTGGAESHQLTEAQLPSHSHGAGSLSTASAGSHTHTVSITSGTQSANHTHSISITSGIETVGHSHNVARKYTADTNHTHSGASSYTAEVPNNGASTSSLATDGASANHTHNVVGTSASNSANHTHLVSGSTASNGSHTHTISGSTGSTGSGSSFGLMNPFLALTFIIKT